MLKAGSAARRITISEAQLDGGSLLAPSVEAFLRAVDRTLQITTPAWVGHCKVLVSGVTSSYASITMANDEIRWAGGAPPMLEHAEITVYAAVYSLADGDVAAALDQNLALLQLPHHV
ncbi:MAG: hypothetical protein NVSMB42_11160 [Herpetosiphon sp.]